MLPAPRLDDRAFQDLVDDAKRLVMRRCPEWTDHNISDPGVTLIETFAYMTDALLYRLNRVPDRLYVKFLDLIGLRLFPATSARVAVTFWLAAPPPTTFTIPRGTEVTTAGTEHDEPIVFGTADVLELVPTRLEAFLTQRHDGEIEDHSGESARFAQDDRGDHRAELAGPVAVFSDRPVPGDLMYAGLDVAAPRCAIRLDVVAQAEGVGVNPHRPPLVWEAWCGEDWVECEITDDETGGLNRSGSLVVHVPDGHVVSVEAGRAAGWLRARVVEPDDGQPPYSASPIVRSFGVCTIGGTVTAVNAELVDVDVLGEAEGVAGQRFDLTHRPVLAGVVEPIVEVSSDDGWQRWERVEHFAESGPTSRHFVLDPTAGQLSFGPLVRLPDGGVRQYGGVPEAGAVVRIRDYTVGGGPRGNVAPGSIVSLRSSVPFVTGVENRRAGTGGTEPETLEQAMERGPLTLRTRERAVTAEDFEILARSAAPEIARVRCVPADGAGVPAGTVKVLVVPAAPVVRHRVRLEDLIPRESTLRRIAERLEETKVAGVRVALEPPRYRGVTVVARLVARPRVNARQVTADALDALYRLINPLPGGGPDGQGWPFGRPVHQGEVFAALRDVRGVELVEDLRLFAADPVTGQRGEEVQRLPLDKHSLVFSFEHQVRVEER